MCVCVFYILHIVDFLLCIVHGVLYNIYIYIYIYTYDITIYIYIYIYSIYSVYMSLHAERKPDANSHDSSTATQFASRSRAMPVANLAKQNVQK